MKKGWRRKTWAWILVGGAGVLVLTTAAINMSVMSSAEGRIYTDTEAIPFRPTALVLGTSPTVQGRKNLFFERRMAAAARLYRSGKVALVLVSGDNGSRGYDEPSAMRDALIRRGVPEAAILLDYAGFRTLDSVYRARDEFGVESCTIVTDDFHLPRALYIAKDIGLDAIEFQTEPLDRSLAPKTYVREVGARVLVWIDLHVLKRQPKFPT